MFWAINSKNFEIVQLLFVHGFLSIYEDKSLLALLLSSMGWSDQRTFLFLIEKFSTLYQKYKWSFIDQTINVFAFERFLNFMGDSVKFDIDYQRKPDRYCLLHIAVDHLRPKFVEVLLERGANPFLRNILGESPYDLCKIKANGLDKEGKRLRSTILSLLPSY